MHELLTRSPHPVHGKAPRTTSPQRIGNAALAAAVCSVLLLAGCHTAATNPSALRVPQKLSCIHVAQPLQVTEYRGPFKVLWETRLAEGPYISEREDERGTFYRGPPGAYSLASDPKKADGTNTVVQVRDGGIYVPLDGTTPPSLYVYFTGGNVEAKPVAPGTTCTSPIYTRDLVTRQLGVAASSPGGVTDGAAGSVGAGVRAVAASGASPGKSAAYGEAGGAIGGAIVTSLINMDVGKIVPIHTPADPRFAEQLKKLAREAVPVQPASAQGGRTEHADDSAS